MYVCRLCVWGGDFIILVGGKDLFIVFILKNTTLNYLSRNVFLSWSFLSEMSENGTFFNK